MSDLNDLKIPSITDMSTNEAIEHLRTIRLSRRTPVKKVKSASTKKNIKQSLEEYERGEFYTWEEVKKELGINV